MANESGQPIIEKKESSSGDGTHMHVKVYAPFKVYFDGDALSISAVNDTGPFDILTKHHNFMTLINTGNVVELIKVKKKYRSSAVSCTSKKTKS
jgi:F0F1-type ATP synthase epsilon subunit